MNKFLPIVLILVNFMPESATGGEVTESSHSACDYDFTGAIEPGDDARISQIAPKGALPPVRLCLSSPSGGDLSIGLKIFYQIWENNIDTMVVSDEECSSACAIAFMAGGNVQGTDSTRQTERKLMPGAKLGFHGPSLDLPDGRTQRTEVVQGAFYGAISVASDLFYLSQISERGASTMTDFLLGRILQTPDNEMYYIETVGDAVLSDIQLFGVEYPGGAITSELKKEMVLSACLNVVARNPPDDGYRRLHKSARDHYMQLFSFFYEGGSSISNREGIRVMLERPANGKIRGWAGPFGTGSKYYQNFCLAEIEPEYLGSEYVVAGRVHIQSWIGSYDDFSPDWNYDSYYGLRSYFVLPPGRLIESIPIRK